jgi:ribosomal protein L37AE/L43A
MSFLTPKKKSLISKINIQEYYQKQKANQNCADCNLPMPKFVSINNGIFICSNCAKIHQNLGYNISFIRSVEDDFFDPYLTSFLDLGGNSNFLLNLGIFNINVKTPIEIKYKTRACEYYRILLKSKIECDEPPSKPNLENAQKECDNIEYFPEFKNYVLFRGEIDNNEDESGKFGIKNIVKGSMGLMFNGVKFLGGLTVNGMKMSYNYFKNRNNNNGYDNNNNNNNMIGDFDDFHETKNGVVKNNNNNNNYSYNQNYNNNNNYSYNQNYNNYNTNNFNNNNNIENNNKYSTNHIYNNNNIYSLNNEDNNNIYNNYPPLNNNNNNIFTINNKNPIINNNNNNNKYPLYDSNNFKDENNDNNNNNIYIKNQPFIVTNESVQICEEEPINENMITSEEKFNPTCEYENTNKEKARKDANNFLLES